MKGYFITFEGVEGAGKSTQAKMLHAFLQERNIPSILTREPGGTNLGKKIREILLTPTEEIFPPNAELMLYEADRNIHVHNVIKPNLEKGITVICDRFTDSTLAYQGYARGLDLNLIEELNNIATEGLKPDLTFLIDIPVEEGFKRIKKEREIDRIEQESFEFHKRLREGFLKIAEKDKRRVIIIDGEKSPNEIFEEIVKNLKERTSLI